MSNASHVITINSETLEKVEVLITDKEAKIVKAKVIATGDNTIFAEFEGGTTIRIDTEANKVYPGAVLTFTSGDLKVSVVNTMKEGKQRRYGSPYVRQQS